jgi:hypothetical protein
VSFFDRRKKEDRRSEKNGKKGENVKSNEPNRRSGEDRRKGIDRRSDKYHQLKSDRRKVIDQIIDLLEKEIKNSD